jgi:hypothetical protein
MNMYTLNIYQYWFSWLYVSDGRGGCKETIIYIYKNIYLNTYLYIYEYTYNIYIGDEGDMCKKIVASTVTPAPKALNEKLYTSLCGYPEVLVKETGCFICVFMCKWYIHICMCIQTCVHIHKYMNM